MLMEMHYKTLIVVGHDLPAGALVQALEFYLVASRVLPQVEFKAEWE